ncbi:hypothetical protein BRC65_00650, partial [Halobacteriales archaeon QH_2_65_14]
MPRSLAPSEQHRHSKTQFGTEDTEDEKQAGDEEEPSEGKPPERELSPAEALRTALRLGDGALVVGEVRGEEAAVLYEAMRVGA